MTDIFIDNCSLSARASLGWGTRAWSVAAMAAQAADPAPLLRSVGESIFKKTGDKLAAEGAMELLAYCCALGDLAAGERLSDDQLADLFSFFAERIRHNADVLGADKLQNYARAGDLAFFLGTAFPEGRA